MPDKHICVAIYMTPPQADEAFSRLEVEGFAMDLLSIAGRDYYAGMAGSRHSPGGFSYAGKLASFWERLWANLPGWGVFYFFDTGPLLVAGSLVQSIVAAHQSRDGNGKSHDPRRLSDFEAGLSDIGIPRESIVQYEAALLKDQILLFVFGNIEEVELAQRLLNETKAINHTLHHSGEYERERTKPALRDIPDGGGAPIRIRRLAPIFLAKISCSLVNFWERGRLARRR